MNGNHRHRRAVVKGGMRYIPWLLTLLVVALALKLVTLFLEMRPERGEIAAMDVWSVQRPANRATCESLYVFSAQAAVLTGSLVLVDAEGRSAQAEVVAGQVRGLAAEVAALDHDRGRELTAVLGDLVDALEGYAEGHPAALGGVREASARNALLRAQYQSCTGGDNDE